MPLVTFYTSDQIHQMLELKADKVANAITNDLAALDTYGNLKDSGYDIYDLIFGGDFDGGTF